MNGHRRQSSGLTGPPVLALKVTSQYVGVFIGREL